jgi:hypothetical protein
MISEVGKYVHEYTVFNLKFTYALVEVQQILKEK